MRRIDVCGCRGLGDLISSIPRIMCSLKERAHVVFHYPPGFDYDTTIKTIIDQLNIHPNVTYEVQTEGYTVRFNAAAQMYGLSEHGESWFFTRSGGLAKTTFTTKWKGNKQGPIALAINNENTTPSYPYPEKWFDNKLNTMLSNLVDGENYVLLGRPLSVKENIEILANCRYAIGTDGAWAHCAKYTQTPYYLVRNNLSMKILQNMHANDPWVKIVETDDIFRYLGR